MADIFLFAGLGNPGEEFKKTRHNLGRDIVAILAKKLDFPNLILNKKFQSLVSEGKVGKQKLVLACPETSMNKSGEGISSLARFYKIKPENIFVIHDDSDLELGRTKLSFGRHSAGHKGIESIIKSVKTLDFWRFRIGVGSKKHVEAEKIILKKFSSKETAIVKKLVKKTVAAVEKTVGSGPEMAMNEYNANT